MQNIYGELTQRAKEVDVDRDMKGFMKEWSASSCVDATRAHSVPVCVSCLSCCGCKLSCSLRWAPLGCPPNRIAAHGYPLTPAPYKYELPCLPSDLKAGRLERNPLTVFNTSLEQVMRNQAVSATSVMRS